MPFDYDAIVVGAGPAGLSAGITLAKHGKSVLILDKQARNSRFPRGETIHRLPFVEEQVLYPGFYEKHVINRTNRRAYYSASGRKCTETTLKAGDENLIFEYGPFIEDVTALAEKAGATVRFRAEVAEVLEANGVIRGVKLADSPSPLSAKVVIGAGGHACPVAKKTGVSARLLLDPIMKVVGEAPEFTENRLEFHFVGGAGQLPGVCFVFPRGGHLVETGFSVFPECLPDPAAAAVINIEMEWERQLAGHPTYSKVMQGLQPSFKGAALVPFARLLEDAVPQPGAVLLGDTLSQVEPMGGSGINAALEMGYYVAQACLHQLFAPASEGSAFDAAFWQRAQAPLLAEIQASPRFLKLRKQYKVIPRFKRWFFRKMDRRWWVFNLLLKLR